MLRDHAHDESFDYATVVPADAAGGVSSGKRQHMPFTITEQVDKSSPVLFALGTKFSRLVFQRGGITYTVTGATVVSTQTANGLQTFALTYRTITWVVGGKTFTDDWEQGT